MHISSNKSSLCLPAGTQEEGVCANKKQMSVWRRSTTHFKFTRASRKIFGRLSIFVQANVASCNTHYTLAVLVVQNLHHITAIAHILRRTYQTSNIATFGCTTTTLHSQTHLLHLKISQKRYCESAAARAGG